MKKSNSAPTLLFVLVTLALAHTSAYSQESFVTELECRTKVSEYRFEYRVADKTAYDCNGHNFGGQFRDCRGLDSASRQKAFWEIVRKRDNIKSEIDRLEQICISLSKGKSANPYTNNPWVTESQKNSPREKNTRIATRTRNQEKTYSAVHKAADDLQARAQEKQSPVINKIQNTSRSEIKSRNKQTLDASSNLSESIRSLKSEDAGKSF